MSVLTLDDESINKLAKELALQMSGTNSEEKPAAKKKKKEKAMDSKTFLALCDDYKEKTDRKELKKVLGEFDFKSPKHVPKEDYIKVSNAIKKAMDLLSDDGDDDGDDEDDDEGGKLSSSQFSDLKEAYQDYIDDNSAKEGKAILMQYGVNKIADVKNLDNSDFDEIMDDLT